VVGCCSGVAVEGASGRKEERGSPAGFLFALPRGGKEVAEGRVVVASPFRSLFLRLLARVFAPTPKTLFSFWSRNPSFLGESTPRRVE